MRPAKDMNTAPPPDFGRAFPFTSASRLRGRVRRAEAVRLTGWRFPLRYRAMHVTSRPPSAPRFGAVAAVCTPTIDHRSAKPLSNGGSRG